MITLLELIKNTKVESISAENRKNLDILLDRLNQIRTLWGKPMIITSGFRSLEHHLRIYKEKGITDQSKIPMKSHHLFGRAADVSDPKRELQSWCLANVDQLEKIGLWCEDFKYTKNWTHFQIIPPKSGNRFFIP